MDAMKTGQPTASTPRRGPRHGLVAAACAMFVAAMVGMAYAAVPLYAMFCSLTGFGGATRVGTAAPETTIDRTITVRFDANVAPGLPWVFKPEQTSMEVKVGETKMAYYMARNEAATPTYANATYNVTPAQAGFYFVKMQCFCFEEQTLAGGEKVDMPVVFYIDPAIAEDEDLKNLKTITLSYTFFPAKPPAPKAAAVQGAGGKGG
ncbi:cytochrome c oxidase assembly protein [Aquabacter spiritensis]|uniref:Cytochrome c oxidase assembly protein CtaG n=1 Tax=Aquabacter spiritensis TaxID=933073 RepID=A0A4R3LUY0_9HYPH|nr:cytochrome c oxidase assembly protein [Aquabacter spiritensis]TCT03459.1 cytochrome c oxidase assembly protein subunit 11 [Aquabacter spiritensis]